MARQQSLERLRGRKSEIGQEIDQQRAASRFESEGPVDTNTLDEAQSSKTTTKAVSHAVGPSMTDQPKESGYTARLLAAKKEAQKKTGGNN